MGAQTLDREIDLMLQHEVAGLCTFILILVFHKLFKISYLLINLKGKSQTHYMLNSDLPGKLQFGKKNQQRVTLFHTVTLFFNV